MSRRSSSLSNLGLGVLALAGAMVATVHCGTDDGALGPSVQADGGPTGESPDEDAGVVVNERDGGRPVGTKGDGGTVDSGIPAGPITVCGGSKGDPTAVPVLDWTVYNSTGKYEVILGASAPNDEPGLYWSTQLQATGERYEDPGQYSSAVGGAGPFGSLKMSTSTFVEEAMPETDLLFGTLGWTKWNEAVYNLSTKFAVTGWDHFRVAGSAGHYSWQTWSLGHPVKVAVAPPSSHWVRRIEATRGMGWLFVVLFDHACKATEFDALVGDNALNILAPPVGTTRADVSKFLVANNARLVLAATTFGAEDPTIKASLLGTQASAATLDALETTMTGFKAAMKAYMDNASPPNYEAVTTGTDPIWVIGSIQIDKTSNLD